MVQAKKKTAPAIDRLALRKKLVDLLNRESRFGRRDDCRPDLDREWDELLEKVFG